MYDLWLVHAGPSATTANTPTPSRPPRSVGPVFCFKVYPYKIVANMEAVCLWAATQAASIGATDIMQAIYAKAMQLSLDVVTAKDGRATPPPPAAASYLIRLVLGTGLFLGLFLRKCTTSRVLYAKRTGLSAYYRRKSKIRGF